MTKEILTQAKLKELLHYDPDTGIFTWKVAKASCISIGCVAGTVHNPKTGNRTNYRYVSIDNKIYKAHRLAVLYMTGSLPEFSTDHDDGDGLNNKWLNLNVVTQDINMKNLPLRSDNSSGVCGVSLDKRRNKWMAYINSSSGNTKKLGGFIEKWDAICRRKSAEYKYGYHVNHGRFVI